MSDDGLIAALALGVAAGAGLLWLERRKAKPVPAPGSSSACDALKAIDPRAYDACIIAGGLVDGITKLLPNTHNADYYGNETASYAAKDATNRQLNGAVDTPVTRSMQLMGWGTRLQTPGGPTNLGGFPPLQGTVLKFKNGCVPFAGAPGWEKCAQGTQDMWHTDEGDPQSIVLYDNNVDGVPKFQYQAVAGSVGTGDAHGPALKVDVASQMDAPFYNWDHDDGELQTAIGDPSTGIIHPRLGSANDFPLQQFTGGVAGYKAGKPWACPAGTLPDFAVGPNDAPDARDHRKAAQAAGSAGVICQPVRGNVTGYTPGPRSTPGSTPTPAPKPDPHTQGVMGALGF